MSEYARNSKKECAGRVAGPAALTAEMKPSQKLDKPECGIGPGQFRKTDLQGFGFPRELSSVNGRESGACNGQVDSEGGHRYQCGDGVSAGSTHPRSQDSNIQRHSNSAYDTTDCPAKK